ncbi:MAG TPA: hypothetical protein VFH33_00725 [Candidatus Krumholzibacteria bacterium]|nr:hypothetical protein [Candidatus Krumholzibacteria bacterium]
MKATLVAVLVIALVGVVAVSATAQVPNIQVYFDPSHTQTQQLCGSFGSPVTLYVVMNSWNMNITGVDFSINYSSALIWLVDNLPDPLTQVSIGQSPTGIAIAYANCCYLNGQQSVEVLLPLVLWSPSCDCYNTPYAVVVGGYTPLGKTQPTAIRKEDFQQFSGVGMTSLICDTAFAVEPSTWGQVKALYR